MSIAAFLCTLRGPWVYFFVTPPFRKLYLQDSPAQPSPAQRFIMMAELAKKRPTLSPGWFGIGMNVMGFATISAVRARLERSSRSCFRSLARSLPSPRLHSPPPPSKKQMSSTQYLSLRFPNLPEDYFEVITPSCAQQSNKFACFHTHARLAFRLHPNGFRNLPTLNVFFIVGHVLSYPAKKAQQSSAKPSATFFG